MILSSMQFPGEKVSLPSVCELLQALYDFPSAKKKKCIPIFPAENLTVGEMRAAIAKELRYRVPLRVCVCKHYVMATDPIELASCNYIGILQLCF